MGRIVPWYLLTSREPRQTRRLNSLHPRIIHPPRGFLELGKPPSDVLHKIRLIFLLLIQHSTMSPLNRLRLR